jgi:hypothetical protein
VILVIGEVNFEGSFLWHAVLDGFDYTGSNPLIPAEYVVRILALCSRPSDDSNGNAFSALVEGSRIRNHANISAFCQFFLSVDRCALYKTESLMRLRSFVTCPMIAA